MTYSKTDRRNFKKPVYSEEINHRIPNSKVNVSESAKDSVKGRVRLFLIDGKTVAYFIGQEGKITKDPLTQEGIRQIHLFFARNHVTYTGKIPQADIEEVTK